MATQSSKSRGDQISSLPDEIIARILSFFPTTKHTAATSILSRRWRYLYCLTHTLDIVVSMEHIQSYLKFVDRVMLIRGGTPLRKLRLRCWIMSKFYGVSRVESWIKTALLLGLQELDIITACLNVPLPDSLWNHNQLTVLKLHCHGLLPSPNVIMYDKDVVMYLPSLRSFYIRGIDLKADFINGIFANCPLLEEVTLHDCFWESRDVVYKLCSKSLKSLELYYCRTGIFCGKKTEAAIDIPTLLYFKFVQSSWASYTLKNLSSLVVVEINIAKDLPCATNLISGVARAKHLRLLSLESIESAGYHYELPIFSNLTKLELEFARSYDSYRAWALVPRGYPSPLVWNLLFFRRD